MHGIILSEKECRAVARKDYARRKPRKEGVLRIGQNLSEEIVKRSLFEFEEKKFQVAATGAEKRIG